jgi:hypothetical protein
MVRVSVNTNTNNINNNISFIQKRNLSEVNQKYIDLMKQNKHDKELAFWGGFIVSSIIMPYGG